MDEHYTKSKFTYGLFTQKMGKVPPTSASTNMNSSRILEHQTMRSDIMGTFGGYTHWAVVFLIIFVLFFLLVPVYQQVCKTVPVY